jgi:hypothetical protein
MTVEPPAFSACWHWRMQTIMATDLKDDEGKWNARRRVDRWFEWNEPEFHRPSPGRSGGGHRPGATVLISDVAQSALTLASRVQPGGRVDATDIAPEMRRRAGERNCESAERRVP